MLSQEQRHPLHQEIAKLRGQVEEARETIRNLRDLLMPPLVFPRKWQLTGAESRLLAALYSNPNGLSREVGHAVVDNNPEPLTEQKIVDVFVCKLRKKMKPYGVSFVNQWGRGYAMTPESFQIVGDALASINATKQELKEICRPWL